jgi:hypothetical protein
LDEYDFGDTLNKKKKVPKGSRSPKKKKGNEVIQLSVAKKFPSTLDGIT